jgi:cysteinyl-tRNA synthetase
MSTKYLGQPFDIHGGGEDLIFPHHENEIAQSCGAAGKDFARNWLHHAFVRIDHEKMSKSLGNIFAIEDVLEEVEAEGLRLNLLSTQYRSPLDFSPTGIAESTTAMLRVYEALARAREAGIRDPGYGFGRAEVRPLWEAMDDDFNTPRAVAFAFDSMRELNRALDAGDRDQATRALGLVLASGACMGLFQEDPSAFIDRYRQGQASEAGVDPQEIEALIAKRNQARGSKDYAEADRIRDELARRGIVLKDGPDGTVWRPA